MASITPQNNEFSRALRMFTESLTAEEKNDFRFSTLEELNDAIFTMKKGSEFEKKRNFRRLQPFVMRMEHYSKVIETFTSGSEIVGAIWVCLSD